MPYVESMLMCGIWHTIADGVIELDRSREIWFWLSLTGGVPVGCLCEFWVQNTSVSE